MSTRHHMFIVEDIVRSVLLGHKITAQCGTVRTLTRDDLKIERPNPCRDCMAAAQTDNPQGYTLRPSDGWEKTLEASWLVLYEERNTRIGGWSHAYKITWKT